MGLLDNLLRAVVGPSVDDGNIDDVQRVQRAAAARAASWRSEPTGIPARPGAADRSFIETRIGRRITDEEWAVAQNQWAAERAAGRGGGHGSVNGTTSDNPPAAVSLLDRFDRAFKRLMG